MAERKKRAKKKVAKKKVVKKVAKKAASKKTAAKKAEPQIKTSGKIRYPKFAEKKNIGNYAKELILRGESTESVIEKVKSKFPTSAIKPAAIGYYRQALKEEGFKLPKS